MNSTVEFVAQAIHEAEQGAGLWPHEPVERQERFREFARNAIALLGGDIGVLLLALKDATGDPSARGRRAAA
jgi:hypothetical protein